MTPEELIAALEAGTEADQHELFFKAIRVLWALGVISYEHQERIEQFIRIGAYHDAAIALIPDSYHTVEATHSEIEAYVKIHMPTGEGSAEGDRCRSVFSIAPTLPLAIAVAAVKSHMSKGGPE
jgi:hypothetical protein